MKYTVIIEETVTDTVTVDAASPEEAEKIVEQGYKEGRSVLTPGELTGVKQLESKCFAHPMSPPPWST